MDHLLEITFALFMLGTTGYLWSITKRLDGILDKLTDILKGTRDDTD